MPLVGQKTRLFPNAGELLWYPSVQRSKRFTLGHTRGIFASSRRLILESYIVKIRKQKKRIAARRRILGLEQLERREVLAGNVAASLRGGNLFLNGDNLANDISITHIAPNSVTITGN